ncbi:MAG TPA: ribosome biogenesis GTPase Der [Planctomycetes bacterium]|nr:ribosome biogenesis GTPase Der [Planctomycetota bacterium]
MTESPKLPTVVIVGRPNVGKSTLLNRIVRSRVSIVEPTEGVTRDRVSVRARIPGEFGERYIELIDTGGVGIVDRDDLGPHVEEQVRAALIAADLVLFLVDAKAGTTPLDQEVARRLRGIDVPVLLVCNKVEGERASWEVDSFRALGVGEEPVAISAQNGTGMTDLFERMEELLPPYEETDMESLRLRPALKLAVVGRRNAGKSTFINAVAREDRAIVSEVPGTTRDALDVIVERDGETLVLIDTAGVRRRKRHDDAVEFFSDARAHKAIRRADVVLLLFDATRNLSSVEKRLARYVVDHYRVVLLGANKWDLALEKSGGTISPEDYRAYLDQELPGISYAPCSFLSAKTGLHVKETLELAKELGAQSRRRVATGELNRVLERALEARSPSSKGYRVRVRYATQAEVAPPTFVLFVNDKRLIGRDYLRYLENRVREELPFTEVPVRFVLKDKRDKDLSEDFS